MSKPTKRARKKDSTMLNNQARKKEIAMIKVQLNNMHMLIGEQRAFIARILFAAQEFMHGDFRGKK